MVSDEVDFRVVRYTSRAEWVRQRAAWLESIATVLIVAASVGLSIAWAFAVPIFESPDEPVHFQYALDVALAGRPLLARTAVATLADNPEFVYLANAVDLNRIAFHNDQRVPAGYGSRAFYERVDRGAPVVTSSSYDRRATNPRLIATYPPGYYWFAALWIAAAMRGLHLGLVEGFFAARLSSVFLFALTLAFTAILLRQLRIDRGTRILLLTAAGMTPLCTFVSSYVQPDVAVATLIVASALAAVRYRERPCAGRVVVLSLAIAACSTVKLQYAAAAFLGSLVVFAAAWPRNGHRRSLQHAALLVGPLALVQVVQHQILWMPPALYAASVHPTFEGGQFWAAVHRGGLHLVSYAVRELGAGIWNFHLGGFPAVMSYWGDFGWLDSPIDFGTVTANILGTASIKAFNLAVFVMSLLAAVAIGWIAVRRIRRAGLVSALRLLGADPVLAILLAYDAIMLALYVYAPVPGYQGRYWYPVVVLLMIALVRCTPHSFPLAVFRRRASRAIAALLCLWALLGSIFAAHTVHDRYYGSGRGVGVSAVPDERPARLVRRSPGQRPPLQS